MTQMNPLLMGLQPRSDSEKRDAAIVSWHLHGNVPTVISRFSDMVWEGAPVGAMAAMPTKARQIDFKKMPTPLVPLCKDILYAFLRHPINIASTPSFASLIKRGQAVAAFASMIQEKGLSQETLTTSETRAFLLDRARKAKHIETLVSIVATLRGAAVHHGQGLIAYSVQYPFPIHKGAQAVAKALWHEAHGRDFDGRGEIPYSDEDLTLIVRNAHFYVEELGPHVRNAIDECLTIADRFPNLRESKSADGHCYRAQKKYIKDYSWPHSEAGLFDWPPTTFKSLMGHARLCSAASTITVSFATGSRRSEINSISDGCIRNKYGEAFLTLTHYKGRDESDGEIVALPVDDKVICAIELQSSLKKQIRRYIHADLEGTHAFTDKLFVQSKYQAYGDTEEASYTIEGAALSANAHNHVLAKFSACILPDLGENISFTRLRKSVARLITLSMEGATVILQSIFGHATYRTTLGYMFASPMIQDELLTAYPELTVKNLKTLFAERDSLMGGGAPALRAAIKTESDIDMTENEFVELGLDMMSMGQMLLSVLGQGMYCLKPLVARGPCNSDSGLPLPNLGNCSGSCSHHLLLGSERPKLIRQAQWLKAKIQDPLLSEPMKNFYKKNLDEIQYVIEKT